MSIYKQGDVIIVGNKHASEKNYTTIVGQAVRVVEATPYRTYRVLEIPLRDHFGSWQIQFEDALPPRTNEEALLILSESPDAPLPNPLNKLSAYLSKRA